MSLDDSDPTFTDDLEASDEAVQRVALWLYKDHGLPVVLQPTFVRPDS